ncbi:MAG: hypothetical protein KDA71_04270 [Planctomycetales bacterium]|nr:hypothetical protein [Planctomycetales bacterium]
MTWICRDLPALMAFDRALFGRLAAEVSFYFTNSCRQLERRAAMHLGL